MFTKLPPKQTYFKKGSPAQLTCEMKAPTDAVVYWSLKQGQSQECKIPPQDSNVSSSTYVTENCGISAVAHLTIDQIDRTFSLFHLELKVRHGMM